MQPFALFDEGEYIFRFNDFNDYKKERNTM